MAGLLRVLFFKSFGRNEEEKEKNGKLTQTS